MAVANNVSSPTDWNMAMHDSPQPVIQSTNRLVAEVREFFGVVSDPVAMAVVNPEHEVSVISPGAP